MYRVSFFITSPFYSNYFSFHHLAILKTMFHSVFITPYFRNYVFYHLPTVPIVVNFLKPKASYLFYLLFAINYFLFQKLPRPLQRFLNSLNLLSSCCGKERLSASATLNFFGKFTNYFACIHSFFSNKIF